MCCSAIWLGRRWSKMTDKSRNLSDASRTFDVAKAAHPPIFVFCLRREALWKRKEKTPLLAQHILWGGKGASPRPAPTRGVPGRRGKSVLWPPAFGEEAGWDGS